MSDDELLHFAPEHPEVVQERPLPPWKALVVDDEESVLDLTRLALKDFVFEGRGVELLFARSVSGAQMILSTQADIAFILLDVVMEADDSGLQLVKWIRETLQNRKVRIILRTGQPGLAPEEEVILEYEINDYKSKTELTIQKLFTTVVTALRSYRDLVELEHQRIGMEMVLRSRERLGRARNPKALLNAAADILPNLLHLQQEIPTLSLLIARGDDRILVETASGEWEGARGKPLEEVLDPELQTLVSTALKSQKSLLGVEELCLYTELEDNSYRLLCARCPALPPWQRHLLQLFLDHFDLSFQNLALHHEIEVSQREMIFALGEMTETHSTETSHHVHRVSECAYLLATLAGLDEQEAELVRVASALHDVGKVAIPDRILNKPSTLDEEERQLMQTHVVKGAQILSYAQRRLFQVARTIALQHHEAWDGTGYPQGLKGEEISLYARITTIVDVFDALANDRIYRPAWSPSQIRDFFIHQRGKIFDPRLTDLFLENFHQFWEILTLFGTESLPEL